MIVEIDVSEAVAGFEAMLHRVTDLRPMFEEVGAWQEQKTVRRIEETKLTPHGALWAEWQLGTFKKRQQKGNVSQGLLWDTGLLLNSFSWETDESGVEIGTTNEIAPWLQDGTSKMVARPFMLNEGEELPPEDIAELEMITNLYLRGD